MNRFAWAAVALLLLTPFVALAQSGTVESIEVQGLFRMTRQAFLHAFGIRPGDPYSPQQIRTQFRELWKLGLFEDISIEAETSPTGGKVLVVKLRERPVLSSVTYDDNKVASRTEIEDRLRERNLSLKLGKPIDMGSIAAVEGIIRDLLGEGGYLDGQVESEVRKVTETTRSVHYYITPGGKTRIKKIEFEGNQLYKDKKLSGALQVTEARRWYWPWSQKNLYHPMKWEQDVSNIRDLYQNAGYLDVEIRPPVVEVKRKDKQARQDGKGGPDAEAEPAPDAQAGEQTAAEPQPEPETPAQEAPGEPTAPMTAKQLQKQQKREEKARRKARKAEQDAQKKDKAWVLLEVGVKEGPQYKLGDLTISGNEKYPSELLRAAVPLASGGVLRNNALEAGVESIRRLYANQGHLYATVVRRINRREDENVADVEIVIEEDKPYHVAQIEFAGNTATRDKVLRREMLLAEGDLFSRDRLDVSKIKVNQLGYFTAPDDPVIEPIEGESQVGITVVGEEAGRNEIQVGGGYSGVDGAFFNGVYSTRNFLGRGQTVSVALQVGGRSSRYQLSFQEPWFLNRPILMGASIFRREVDYGSSLRSTSTGFGVIGGRRLGRWGQFNVGYNWESVSSQTFIGGDTGTVSSENTISSITPVYSFSSINNPYRATRGRSITLSMQIAGGPLGGNTSYIKPVARFTNYKRLWGNRYLATHAQIGMVREWANGSQPSASNIFGVPRFQRFWLGGDTMGPRVFETRSITPIRYVVLTEDADGRDVISDVVADPRGLPADIVVPRGGSVVPIEVGGDRFFMLQTELVWPLNEQAEIAFFVDFGDALFEDQSFNFDTTRVSAGLEMRFHLPIFPVPLRLIYGWPVREVEGDRTSSFTFSIGRSF